jgi:hypothetical protein
VGLVDDDDSAFVTDDLLRPVLCLRLGGVRETDQSHEQERYFLQGHHAECPFWLAWAVIIG